MARGKLTQGHPLSRHVRVGLMLIVVLVLLAYSVWQVGRLFDVFASRYTLVTLVEGSGGLIEGAPVTLAGQRVGQVSGIRFIPVEERRDGASLLVTLSVNQNVRDQIRGDSEASLRTQGLLGDRFVDILPGTAPYPAMEPGDTLPSRPPLDYELVLETAAGTLEQVQTVVGDLEIMTDRIVAGEGTVGALLADDRLYERMVVASGELARLMDSVNRSDGTLARLIRDPAMYEQMNRSLARLDSLGAVIMAGEGSLGRLVTDDALYEGLVSTVGRADSAVLGLQGFVENVNESDGALNRLLQDPALYDEFLRTIVDLQNLIRDVREDPRRFRPEVQVDVF